MFTDFVPAGRGAHHQASDHYYRNSNLWWLLYLEACPCDGPDLDAVLQKYKPKDLNRLYGDLQGSSWKGASNKDLPRTVDPSEQIQVLVERGVPADALRDADLRVILARHGHSADDTETRKAMIKKLQQLKEEELEANARLEEASKDEGLRPLSKVHLEQLSNELLQKICGRLSIAGTGSRSDVMQRLKTAGLKYKDLERNELKHILEAYGKPLAGTKPHLITRLLEIDELPPPRHGAEATPQLKRPADEPPSSAISKKQRTEGSSSDCKATDTGSAGDKQGTFPVPKEAAADHSTMIRVRMGPSPPAVPTVTPPETPDRSGATVHSAIQAAGGSLDEIFDLALASGRSNAEIAELREFARGLAGNDRLLGIVKRALPTGRSNAEIKELIAIAK
ncbi:hypothetical protein DFJ74DRAFT_682549 [Hyaloraphidium curvatum]|nr:hypothetical protein DFJ74DRAFT_682549 [Hyaloraphidium curvatum]